MSTRRVLYLQNPHPREASRELGYLVLALDRVLQMEFRRDHPFLRFPKMLDDTPLYEARLEELRSRPVLAAIHLDREILV
ncbi:hypothetical protein L1887_15321 [Cichorium endivia]|nr:hypothetical protein L1887_15321 [Cichorium endivia]